MLRVDLVIDRYGQGDDIYPIYKLEIGNLGVVRDLGFGNEICRYRVRLMKHNNETMRNLLGVSEWEQEGDDKFVEEHNRRDGAIELVRKASELFSEEG